MATTKKSKKNPLRQRAEKLLFEKSEAIQKIPAEDIEKLIHELQVHQVELEMQNEELRKAQVEIEESRSKYVDLYDFSPVGHFTLTSAGKIAEVNLTGARLLSIERGILVGQMFSTFVAPDSLFVFFEHSRRVLKSEERVGCELKLTKKDKTSFHALLEGIAVSHDGTIRIRAAVSDITERKCAEEEILRLNTELERRVIERTAQLETANKDLRNEITMRKQTEEEREKLIQELREAFASIKTLRGLLPICASCKKIRDDRGYWNQIEEYLRDHSEVEFSHGICPDCFKKLYGDV